MNGNNHRNSYHHGTNQYLVAEQEQQFSKVNNNNNNNCNKHLQVDPLVASSRSVGAIYNGLPMHQQHQQQQNQQIQQHSTMGFHQHQQANGNGSNSRVKGPAASDYSMPPMPISSTSALVKQLTDQLNQTHLDQQHQYNQQHQYYQQSNQHRQHHHNHESTLNGNGKSLDPKEYQQHYSPSRHQLQQEEVDGDFLNMDYATQLRQSQFKHKYQQQHHNDLNQYNASQQQHYQQTSSSSSNHNTNSKSNNSHNQYNNNLDHHSSYETNYNEKVRNLNTNEQNSQQQSVGKSTMHVNFNRCSRPDKDNGQNGDPGDDESESPGRKKKYLTAKYGQQQMNLIKKRLKVEMWLYEQLKELAKGTKSEVSN